MQNQDPVKALVKKVGRGKTLARDLSRGEAQEAMERLLRGEFSPAQVGAFLQAMRIKETSIDELVGAAEGAGKFRQVGAELQPEPQENPLVVNLAFDTARKGGVLSLAALAYLKWQGLMQPLVVWEPATLFTKPGAIANTLEALQSHPGLASSIPLMVSVRDLCPPWAGLSAVREELGFRTILNSVEKLLRPWPTAPVVVGISHETFSQRLCHVLFALGAPRGAVVRGHHGTCDLGFGEKATEFNQWEEHQISEGSVAANAFPWPHEGAALLVSAMDDWRAWMRDEASPLWGMIRAQAAFFYSIGTGRTLAESVHILQNSAKGVNNA